MKAFSIAVAVTLVLAFICIMESYAVPVTGVQELEETGSNDTPVAEHQETSMEWFAYMMPGDHTRQKRQISMCIYCYGCCKDQKGWGPCCRF